MRRATPIIIWRFYPSDPGFRFAERAYPDLSGISPFSIHSVPVAEFERSESADPFDEPAERIQIRDAAAHRDFRNRKIGSAEQRARLFNAG